MKSHLVSSLERNQAKKDTTKGSRKQLMQALLFKGRKCNYFHYCQSFLSIITRKTRVGQKSKNIIPPIPPKEKGIYFTS